MSQVAFSRQDRFLKDGGEPIDASVPGYEHIPVEQEVVAFIGLGEDWVFYAKTLQEKRDMVFDAGVDDILIAWPGKYCQDIFYVDDIDALRRRLGFSLKDDYIKVDEDNRKWKLKEC